MMEESGPAMLGHPSPRLSLAPVQQLKRKQGKLNKEASSCSLAAVTGGWGEWAISNFVCHPMLCLMCDLYMLFCVLLLCVCVCVHSVKACHCQSQYSLYASCHPKPTTTCMHDLVSYKEPVAGVEGVTV